MTDGRTGIAIAGAAITDGCGPSLPTIWSQEMRRRNLWSLVLSCFLILPALPVGSAATRLLGAPAAAAAPAGDTDEVLTGVQSTLDARSSAESADDVGAFQATIDRGARTLYGVLTERF